MNWLQKISADRKPSDWIEMISKAFKLMDHPRGPFKQWTEPYLGHVSFMNKAQDIRINLTGEIYFLSHIRIHCIVEGKEAIYGSFAKVYRINDFKQLSYDVVSDIYNLIDNPQTGGEDHDNNDPEPEVDPSPSSGELMPAGIS